jgi:hypothetical protein
MSTSSRFQSIEQLKEKMRQSCASEKKVKFLIKSQQCADGFLKRFVSASEAAQWLFPLW